MLIVYDLYHFLDENNLLERFIENSNVEEAYSVSDAFEWESSPEGQGYWHRISEDFDKRRKNTTQFMVEV